MLLAQAGSVFNVINGPATRGEVCKAAMVKA